MLNYLMKVVIIYELLCFIIISRFYLRICSEIFRFSKIFNTSIRDFRPFAIPSHQSDLFKSLLLTQLRINRPFFILDSHSRDAAIIITTFSVGAKYSVGFD